MLAALQALFWIAVFGALILVWPTFGLILGGIAGASLLAAAIAVATERV